MDDAADCIARERRRTMALRTAATGSRMAEMLASGFGRGDKKAATAPARGSNLQKLPRQEPGNCLRYLLTMSAIKTMGSLPCELSTP